MKAPVYCCKKVLYMTMLYYYYNYINVHRVTDTSEG